MRNIYLLRHGQPDFPGGERLCLSSTDLPLSTLGRLQAVLLGEYFRGKGELSVFHSGMMRTVETASCISDRIYAVPELRELGVGAWEGLPFRQIRQQWPDLYRARGESPFYCCIPGGELPVHCRQRGLAAVERLMKETHGDIVLVCHAGINRLILNDLLGNAPDDFLKIPQPYGCINHLIWEDGAFAVQETGWLPRPALDEDLCQKLLTAAGTPVQVQAHCHAVAKKALELAERVGFSPDMRFMKSVALLHDIARAEKDHPAVGARWMEQLGYPQAASVIACHHDLPEEEEGRITEKTVLYLADKYIQGETEVTLETRFAQSAAKLADHTACTAHERRFRQARRVERLFAEHRREDGM